MCTKRYLIGLGILVGLLSCDPPPPTDGESEIRCTRSESCPTGQYCEYGVCVSGTAPSGGDTDHQPNGDSASGGDEYQPSGDDYTPPVCDCPGLQGCHEVDGSCIEPTLCAADADCIAPNVCVIGRCEPMPACREDGDCEGLTEVCDVNGAGDFQCCTGGFCPECSVDDDCPGLALCDFGVCGNSDVCATDLDCIGSYRCATRCDGFDTSGCTGGPTDCGDGVINGADVCDGSDLDDNNCASAGPGVYSSGNLACLQDCSGFDFTGCVPISCGNPPSINDDEVCDIGDLGGETCDAAGFGTGDVACLETCGGFDYSECTAPPSCGDGLAEGEEVCDGADYGGLTCDDFGFSGGELACAASACMLNDDCVDDAGDTRDAAEVVALTDGFASLTYEACQADFDWFSIGVTPHESVVIRISFDRYSGDLRAVYDLGDEVEAVIVDPRPFGVLLANVDDVATDTVYLRVEENGLNFGRADRIPYSLEIFTTPECRDDDLEFNDTVDTAVSVVSGDTAEIILCSDNQDWFALELAAGNTLRVTLESDQPVTAEVFRGRTSRRVIYDRIPVTEKVLEYEHTGNNAETMLVKIYYEEVGRTAASLFFEEITP